MFQLRAIPDIRISSTTSLSAEGRKNFSLKSHSGSSCNQAPPRSLRIICRPSARRLTADQFRPAITELPKTHGIDPGTGCANPGTGVAPDFGTASLDGSKAREEILELAQSIALCTALGRLLFLRRGRQAVKQNPRLTHHRRPRLTRLGRFFFPKSLFAEGSILGECCDGFRTECTGRGHDSL